MFQTRRAKIVCTLGPASASPAAVRALIDAGMDVARLNFSHGERADHAALARAVREASDASGRAVGLLADLQGPKIRLGRFAGGWAELLPGAEFTLTTRDVEGDAARASTTYVRLARDVKPGDTLLLDDGRVRLAALDVAGDDVRCRVVEGGIVSDHKGINLPGVAVSAPALSDKDAEDLRFALELGVDLVALSFVRTPADRAPVDAILGEQNRRVPVIAKLEKPEAVANLEAIVDAFDGLMVARGDLGVELPLTEVPLVQKRAVRAARERGRPVIVATQMLENMIRHPHPTRAEASDVANAVFDGADAVMLSGETSVGEHPIEAVRTMASLVASAEPEALRALPSLGAARGAQPDALAAAAAHVAADVGAIALVAFTLSGSTARLLARQRCPIPLLAFTTEPAVRSQLALTWGVETFVVPYASETDEMVRQVDRAMIELGRGRRGDSVVIVAGTPPGAAGNTNLIRVHHLGEI